MRVTQVLAPKIAGVFPCFLGENVSFREGNFPKMFFGDKSATLTLEV